MRKDNIILKGRVLVSSIIGSDMRTTKDIDATFPLNKDFIKNIFEVIKNSIVLKDLFDNYRKKLNYAKNVEFEDTISALKEIIKILDSELVGL